MVEADTAKMNRQQLADAVEKLGYGVSATEVQQYRMDKELYGLIKQRGTILLL